MYNRKYEQGISNSKYIKNISEEYGISEDEVKNIFKEREQDYARDEGVDKGEYVWKKVSRNKSEYVRFDDLLEKDKIKFRPEIEQRIEQEKKWEEQKTQPVPIVSPEEKTIKLNKQWLLQEVNKPNITEEWVKNPENYNKSVRNYIDDKLLKLEDKDDIMEIIDFGNELKKSNIDLSKKGAFPGLKEELKRLQDKMIDLLYKSPDLRFRASYARALQKAFSWAKDILPDFTAKGFGYEMGLTERPEGGPKVHPEFPNLIMIPKVKVTRK